MNAAMEDPPTEDARAAATRSDGSLRSAFGRVVLEVFSIVLGVLLALAVSQWQEQRSIDERVTATLGNLRHELASNLRLLQVVHAGNEMIVEALNAGDGAAPDRNFVPGVQIGTSAWQTLGATGLSNHVDHELLLELAELYGIVDVYRRAAFALLDADLMARAMTTARGAAYDDDQQGELMARNFLERFRLLVSLEEALLELHEQALRRLDGRLADARS